MNKYKVIGAILLFMTLIIFGDIIFLNFQGHKTNVFQKDSNSPHPSLLDLKKFEIPNQNFNAPPIEFFPAFVELGLMRIKLSDKEKSHFLNLNLKVCYDKKNKNLGRELNVKLNALRKILNAVIAKKSSAELITPKSRMRLGLEIIMKFSKEIKSGQLINITWPIFYIE